MNTVSAISISFSIIGVLIGVLGYFLRIIHTDLRKACEDIGKLKGKIELVQQEHNLRYEKMEAVTQQKIDRLADEITRLATVLERGFNNQRDEEATPGNRRRNS